MFTVIEATDLSFIWAVLCIQSESCFKNITVKRLISNDAIDEVLTSLGYTSEAGVIESDDGVASSPNIKEER